MSRVNTSTVIAQMVNFQSLWNRAVDLLVGVAMSKHRLSWANAEHSVSVRHVITHPKPAFAGLVNLVPKALCFGALEPFALQRSVVLHPPVVHCAELTGGLSLFAAGYAVYGQKEVKDSFGNELDGK